MTKYRLPFNSSWLTFWGGESLKQNHHYTTPSQKYAFDFIQTDENGSFFRTNGKTNEDYYSFGADIFSPADGVVVEVVEGQRDNRPRELHNFGVLGNYVMIEHSPSQFSVLAHLKQHSITVKMGQKIKSGEKIGQCGNSGYSSDPHLHYHVQDSDIFAKLDKNYKKIDAAKGKKIVFEKIYLHKDRKRRTFSNYSPVKNDIVSNF